MNLFWKCKGILDGWYWQGRYLFQKLYRHNHLSDLDHFECASQLIKIILPRIEAFIKMKKHGTPIFDEEMSDDDREKKWNDILNQIRFAFEFFYQDSFYDKKSERLKAKIKRKYGDWEEKNEANKCHIFMDHEAFYFNPDLYNSIQDKALAGMKLFGEYFLNLWD